MGESWRPFRIENTVLLQHFRDNGNGGVNRIGNDKYECLGSSGSDTSSKTLNDASIDLIRQSES